jgi:hypothetical protein
LTALVSSHLVLFLGEETHSKVTTTTTADNNGHEVDANNNKAAAIKPTRVHADATVTSLAFANDTFYSTRWDDYVQFTICRLCDHIMKLKAQPNAMGASTTLV